MQEIKCPNCGEVFQVAESDYAQIVKQVRDQEFSKEIERREKEMEDRRESDLKIAQMEQEKQHQAEINELNEKLKEKDSSIEQLKLQISNNEVEKKLAVTEAVEEKNHELAEKTTQITELMSKLNSKDTERELKEKTLKESYEVQLKWHLLSIGVSGTLHP